MRIVLILAVALNGLASSAFAQSANSITPLSDLQQEVRDDIARICLPIQYRDGAVAYRTCVKDQITQREETSRINKVTSSFSNLSFDDRYAIQQACGSTGSQSAQDCIAKQITALLALPEPNLSTLSSDEQYVMQQTCFHAQSKQGAAAYRQCQINEVASVKNIATPNYANLGAIERNALQLKCSANQSQLVDYRNCLISGSGSSAATTRATEAVAEISQPAVKAAENQQAVLVTVPVSVQVQTNTSSIRPQLIQPRVITVSPPTTSVPPSVTEPELGQSVPALTTPALAQEPTLGIEQTIEPSDQPQAQSTTDVQPVETVQTTEPVTTTSTAENSENNTPSEESAANIFTNIKNFLLSAFNGLSTQGKLLLAAVVITPFALLALLTGRRRDDYHYKNHAEYEHDDLKSRVRPRAAHRNRNSQFHDDDNDDISANWQAEVDSLFDDTPTIQPEPTQQGSERTEPPTTVEPAIDYSKVDEYAPTKLVPPAHAKDEYAPTKLVSPAQAKQSMQQPTADAPTRRITPSHANGEFAHWLHSLPRDEQQSLAIEFLLYWIAFGDERYEPSLKQQIFLKQDPNNKDIVKRWVLKEDVHAFADVIGWLQRNTTSIQKVQIVHLLMAMLVNGHEPTPVQNTLFRFLSDAFYFKNPTLDEMFEEDFHTTLPPMPRADRMAWWERQSAGTIASWNVRKLNNSDEITRLAAQLGVDGEARSEHVEAAYELASHRCSPERFDHLGENEHNMIQARLNRLQLARDGLLEALA